ncbi:MAG: NYN domain-containing protein [Atribacterota bacterium]|jgi:uncharacterized LabA/DUF88 family protein|nr:NYN domain-containing protein [Atribacterota bacterium]
MKTVWIVDGAYLFNQAKGNKHIDYVKLKNELEILNEGRIYESYFLNSSPVNPNQGQSNFNNWLKSAPPNGPQMRVQIYPLKESSCKCRACGEISKKYVQKGVDVGIAVLILTLAMKDSYDRLILSAGDGDFEDAISHVKTNMGKEVWVNGGKAGLSVDLQSYADKVIWLEDLEITK